MLRDPNFRGRFSQLGILTWIPDGTSLGAQNLNGIQIHNQTTKQADICHGAGGVLSQTDEILKIL